jgi:predicted DNA-binding protein YlxM (UPF0122 family)
LKTPSDRKKTNNIFEFSAKKGLLGLPTLVRATKNKNYFALHFYLQQDSPLPDTAVIASSATGYITQIIQKRHHTFFKYEDNIKMHLQ